MNNFKHLLISTVCTLIMVTTVSSLITYPYFYSETYHYQDGYVREELAGEIDFIICAASQGQRGINPIILDQELGVNSYNIGSPLLTLMGRYYLLKKEIARNPVDTVVIELCYDSLVRDRDYVSAEGDYYLLGRLTTPLERLEYFFMSARFNEYADYYGDALTRGIKCWKELDYKPIGTSPKYKTKGYEPLDANAIPMPEKENFNKEKILTDFAQENLDYLDKIFALCEENNIKVIVIATPLSDGAIMSYDKLDTIHEGYKEICEKWSCEYYNFSLYKGKCDLFKDSNAFYDRNHLSNIGAKTFSYILSDILKQSSEGNDCSDLFYNTYEELRTQEIIPYHNLDE